MTAADLIALLVETTVASSAALALVLLLRRGLRNAFGAGVAYAAWALVPVALVAVLVPAATVPMGAAPPLMVPAMMGAAALVEAAPIPDAALWASIAWLGGALGFALRFAWQQRSFMRSLGRIVRRTDGLHQADAIAGLPAAIGPLRPRIVVPADYTSRYSADQQILMQMHERVHVTRGDLQVNLLAVALRCVFWFNPLLHYAARHFRHDQELACDQRVIARHPHARRAYGEAMLKTQLAAQPLPLGCHWGYSHPLTERIAMLKQPVPTLKRWLGGGALVCLLMLAGGYAAWAAQPKQAATPASVPAGKIDMHVSFRVDDGNAENMHFVVTPGSPVTMSASGGGHAWEISAAAAAEMAAHGRLLMFNSTVRKDGKIHATPKIDMRSGVPGTIRIGEDKSAVGGGFAGIELTVTLAEAATDARAVDAEIAPRRDAQVATLSPPEYPETALKQRIAGEVMLLVDIDAQGKATHVEVERSEPAGVFDAAAVDAAMRWRYTPAVEDGKPVAGRVRVPVTFDPDGDPDAASGQQDGDYYVRPALKSANR